MNAIECVSNLIQQSDLKNADIARALNISPQTLNSRLKDTSNPTAKTLIEILDVLGYDLAIVRKGTKLPDTSTILD